MLLFSTVHGSHLYNTSHSDSDHDYFEVYSNKIGRTRARYAKQTINNNNDVLKVDLSTFMLYASKGVPQFCEAIYSREPDVDILGPVFRLSFRPHQSAINVYKRTIKAFYMRGVEENNNKFKFHAHRLAFNLDQIRAGRAFDPRLTSFQKNHINNNLQKEPIV